MGTLVGVCIAPLGSAKLLFLAAFAIQLTGSPLGPLWVRRLTAAGVVWLWFWTTPIVSDGLRGAIEDRAGSRTMSSLPTLPVAGVLGVRVDAAALMPAAGLADAERKTGMLDRRPLCLDRVLGQRAALRWPHHFLRGTPGADRH